MARQVFSKYWMIMLVMFIAVPVWASSDDSSQQIDPAHVVVVHPADIEVFVREGCPHCAKAERFLAELKLEQPELRIVIRDVLHDQDAQERLQSLSNMHGVAPVRVPTIRIGEQLIVGFSDDAGSGRQIRNLLAHAQFGEEDFSIDFFGKNLSLSQYGLPLFTLAIGLLDGFNPCSMWVLILMISLLAPLNNRPRMLAIAGTFIAVQGLAYYVFMAAWLNLFLLIGLSRISEITIALLALFAGAIHLKDFWRFGWGVSLSIPPSSKPGIYARMRAILQADNIAAAIVGTVILAILVQLVEFMCTSGLPALYTRILTLQQLDAAVYYGYLLLYDLAYMVDDVIVLTVGIITLSQRRLQENEGRWLKLVSGFVMIGLGIVLLLDFS